MEPVNAQSARVRIQVEYMEMPDLKLTFAQIRRLCDLPEEVCRAAMSSLVECGFLSEAANGAFLRTHASPALATIAGGRISGTPNM